MEDGIEGRVEQPLLFINTWTFQWAENVAKIKSLVDTDVTSDSECVYGTALLYIDCSSLCRVFSSSADHT